jgi:2-polyprenyl-3-methyl-5-hydroxy-6-metoxy-1,4-benzoquinol methylase
MTGLDQKGSARVRARGEYICPICKTSVVHNTQSYHCTACQKEYPILFGIPDFRLSPDRYLSLRDERAKAAHLYAFGQTHTFKELIGEYYSITYDVPGKQEARFRTYVENGPARGDRVLDALSPLPQSTIVDIGCGTGGILIAAARKGHLIVGVDIALRWLVICSKRLAEEGVDVELVCADIASPPIAGESFDAGIAVDLMEHIADPAPAAVAIAGMVGGNGKIFVSGVNRYTLAPYPLAGLWGVGFLPGFLRSRYVTMRTGLDTLRYARLTSPYGTARLFRRAGFIIKSTAPLNVATPLNKTGDKIRERLIAIYNKLRTIPGAKQLLVLIGPAFELVASKRAQQK